MTTRLRWGILGTGNIARQFCAGVSAGAQSSRGRVVAVGSRSPAAADAFAAAVPGCRAHGSYAQLLADPNVDAVYVSLPNTLHHEWSIRALAAGKHVLCEKPLALTDAQAQEMFDAADRAGRTLSEAFMYQSHPQTLAVQAAIRARAIGEVKLIRASFCFRTRKIEGNIRFDAGLAGGALMDVGCYCLSLARLIAGREPVAAYAAAHITDRGIDDMASGCLDFGQGLLAAFTCGMVVQADNTATICGTDGYIEIPIPWKPLVKGAQYTIAHSTPPKMDSPTSAAGVAPPRQTFTVDAGGELYALEADDFAAAALDGKPPRVSRQHSLGNAKLLQQLREQVGLRF